METTQDHRGCKIAPMNTDTGKCIVCGDYARDCDCHLCPDCEGGIPTHADVCPDCGYECDEN